MLKKNLFRNLTYIGIVAFSIFATLTQCAKKFEGEDFAPSTVRATVKTVTANGGGALYCSISGGCPVVVTGSDFYQGAKVFFGPYECTNPVVSAARDQINCTVGAGKSGVFDVSVVNRDGKASVFDPSIDPTNLKFSYASFLYLGVGTSPGSVYGYAQNPETGALLSIVGSPFATGQNNTYGTVISPNNKFLFAANVNSKSVSVFAINPVDGKLTAVGGPVVTTINSPNGLFFHPNGRFLYVSDFTNGAGNKGIEAYEVGADGTLTAVAGSPFGPGTASRINGIVVTPNGQFLYGASMAGTGGVVSYTIDQTTGALTLIPGSPFSNTNGGFANTGDGITVHPNGRWVYMGLVGQKRVAAYDIDSSTGALTGIGTPALNQAAGGYPDAGGSGANVSPDGLHFYGTAFSTTGTDPKAVVVYNIDQTTGGLTLASDAFAGGTPNDVRVDTNGKFAYTCNPSFTPSVSAFSRDPATGQLTALTPRDVAIPAPTYGPGIMVIQK